MIFISGYTFKYKSDMIEKVKSFIKCIIHIMSSFQSYTNNTKRIWFNFFK